MANVRKWSRSVLMSAWVCPLEALAHRRVSLLKLHAAPLPRQPPLRPLWNQCQRAHARHECTEVAVPCCGHRNARRCAVEATEMDTSSPTPLSHVSTRPATIVRGPPQSTLGVTN